MRTCRIACIGVFTAVSAVVFSHFFFLLFENNFKLLANLMITKKELEQVTVL
jgi:hypothetical protein